MPLMARNLSRLQVFHSPSAVTQGQYAAGSATRDMVNHVSGTPATMWRPCRVDRKLKLGLWPSEPGSGFLTNRREMAV